MSRKDATSKSTFPGSWAEEAFPAGTPGTPTSVFADPKLERHRHDEEHRKMLVEGRPNNEDQDSASWDRAHHE